MLRRPRRTSSYLNCLESPMVAMVRHEPNCAGCRLGRGRFLGLPAAMSSEEGKDNVTQ